MALTKVIGAGLGTVTDNVVITSDDPTITMTDSSGTNDIGTIQSASGALILTARDGSSDGEIIFKKTDGSATDETLRIKNSGNIGIGTDSPQKLLHLKDGDIVVGNGTASNNAVIGRIGFSTDASNSRFIGIESFRGSDAANGDLRFHTFGGDSDSGERVRIHTNGVLSASDGIALGVGTANTSSNVLDDYEEGTFTPVMEGVSGDPSVTYTVQVGYYTKIGKQVTWMCDIRFSAWTGGSGTLRVNNLPFTNNGMGSGYYSGNVHSSYIYQGTQPTNGGGYHVTGDTKAYFTRVSDGYSTITANSINNTSGHLMLGGTFFTTS